MPQFVPYENWLMDRDERVLEAFGRWIRETRRALGYTQARFGERVGLHQSTISRLERGLVSYLAFPKAIRLFVLVFETLLPPARRG